MTQYLATPPTEYFLMHHGIKGQKWGVKNGPPYPLQNKSGGKTSSTKSTKGSVKKKEESKSKVIKTNKQTFSWGTSEMTNIGSDGTKEGRKQVDDQLNSDFEEARKIWGSELDDFKDNPNEYADFDKFYKFDSIGCKATQAFQSKGQDEALKYLDKELKGCKYDIVFYNEHDIERGYDYGGFTLTIYGDKFGYSTSGDADYTDEQYFFKVKGKEHA